MRNVASTVVVKEGFLDTYLDENTLNNLTAEIQLSLVCLWYVSALFFL